jgi:hypothetical protein
MKKKMKIPDDEAMNPLEDTSIYGAGHEADETLNTDDDIDVHTNGGIPDDTGGDVGDDDDEEDMDDE